MVGREGAEVENRNRVRAQIQNSLLPKETPLPSSLWVESSLQQSEMSASVLGLDPAQLNELKSTINSDIRNALNSTAFDPEKAVDALEQKLDRIVLLLERLVDTISPVLLAATSASTPSAPFGAAQTIPTASYEPVTATFTVRRRFLTEFTPLILRSSFQSATPSTAPQKPANISPFPSASSHTDGFAELLAKHDGKTRTSSESVAHRAYRESFKLHQVDIRDTAEADSPALLQSICGSYPFKRVSPEVRHPFRSACIDR